MRRVFWLAAGLGAGVAGAIMVSRWMRRQQEKLSPVHIGAQVSEGVRDLSELFKGALEEARVATRAREAEIWAQVDVETEAGT